MQQLLEKVSTNTPYFWPVLPKNISEVIVFGAGKRGRDFTKYLQSKGIRVKCFLDNDPAKAETRVGELCVLSPASISTEQREKPVVICSHAYETIEEQLTSLGFFDIYIDMAPGVANRKIDIGKFEKICEQNYGLLEDDESRQTYLGNLLSFTTQDGRYHHMTPYPYLRFPKAHIAPGDIVINVGGFFGDPAILYSSATGNNCEVHTFEPNHFIFPIHCRRLKEAGVESCVTPNCAGIWNTTGFVYLQDLLSIGDSNTSNSHGETVIYVYTVDDYSRKHSIIPTILETGHADLVHPILDGAEKLLRDFRPQFHFSTWPFSEVFSRIKNVDDRYKLYYTQHQTLVGAGGMLYATV